MIFCKNNSIRIGVLVLIISVVFGGDGFFTNEASAANDFIKKLKIRQADGIQFDKNYKFDLNGDGVLDKLVCRNSDYSVIVYDGANTRSELFKWDGPKVNEKQDPQHRRRSSKRQYTGCEVVELTPGKFSIVVSNVFLHTLWGARIVTNQYVIKNVKVNGKPNVQKIKNVDGSNYTVAARSVSCVQYPAKLVKKGYQPGALCFFAGYDSYLPIGARNYGTKTALIKIEDGPGKSLVFKDLTGSAGLIWSGGMSGTPMEFFPSRTSASGGSRMDGLSMMDGAWLDYNSDKLPDLVSVGQHSSIRESQMIFNPDKPEGIEFMTSNILTVGGNAMSEFLTVTALNEQDRKIKLPCLYFSGEMGVHRGDLYSYEVPDHIRCYTGSGWATHLLPGNNSKYSSHMQGPSIVRDKDKGILILAPNYKLNRDGKVPADPPQNLFVLQEDNFQIGSVFRALTATDNEGFKLILTIKQIIEKIRLKF